MEFVKGIEDAEEIRLVLDCSHCTSAELSGPKVTSAKRRFLVSA
jgi:hypothetical protein